MFYVLISYSSIGKHVNHAVFSPLEIIVLSFPFFLEIKNLCKKLQVCTTNLNLVIEVSPFLIHDEKYLSYKNERAMAFLEIIIYNREAGTKLCVNLGQFTSHVRQGTSVRPENVPSHVCAKTGYIDFYP